MLGWTYQEIADLLMAFRRKHNAKPEKALRRDYIARTLTKAKTVAAENGAMIDLGEEGDYPCRRPKDLHSLRFVF